MATVHRKSAETGKEELPAAKDKRFVLVVSGWNSEITENLYSGAQAVLRRAGATTENIIRRDVPGSFELVYGCRKALDNDAPDAVIAIGSVVEGETRHFDFICQGVTHGLTELNLMGKAPVIFCVLTDRHMDQARARSGGKLGNKGEEAAIAALRMADIS